jgi:hypothetical protein
MCDDLHFIITQFVPHGIQEREKLVCETCFAKFCDNLLRERQPKRELHTGGVLRVMIHIRLSLILVFVRAGF